MARFLAIVVPVGLVVVFAGKVGVADEPGPNELRAKAEHLQREAEMLFRHAEEMERGRGPEGRHHMPPPIEEMHQRIDQLREKIEHLHHEGRHGEAEGLEREVQKIKRKIEEMERGHCPEPSHHGPPHDPEHRVRMLNEAADHMFEAAKRLHEADVHDLAGELEREAQRVRQECAYLGHWIRIPKELMVDDYPPISRPCGHACYDCGRGSSFTLRRCRRSS